LEEKRTCKSICKQFKVKKPLHGGRYAAGHARCQTCDIWIDYRCGHLKDGASAKQESVGWYCNCCNFKVRKNPRHTKYKVKLRSSDTATAGKSAIDLSYFNKCRAQMIHGIAKCLPRSYGDFNMSRFKDQLKEHKVSALDVEHEFDSPIKNLVKLAYSTDPPNKMSLILEFDLVKRRLGTVPTKDNLNKHSKFDVSQYESEFPSWEHFLERLGYDPWYKSTR